MYAPCWTTAISNFMLPGKNIATDYYEWLQHAKSNADGFVN